MTLTRSLLAVVLAAACLNYISVQACPLVCDIPLANATTSWYRNDARRLQLTGLTVNVLSKRSQLANSNPTALKQNLCLTQGTNCRHNETVNFPDVCDESSSLIRFDEKHTDELYSKSLDCPWTYKCEYNPKRIPAIVLHASCEQPDGDYECQEIKYMIPVLTTEEDCPLSGSDKWDWSRQLVTVGCARYSVAK